MGKQPRGVMMVGFDLYYYYTCGMTYFLPITFDFQTAVTVTVLGLFNVLRFGECPWRFNVLCF